MRDMYTTSMLQQENREYCGFGAVSRESRCYGLSPAFLDSDTGRVLPSRFSDGRLAQVHVLDGLPEDVVVTRGGSGRVVAVKGSIVAGFVRDGQFYTREEAAREVAGFC
jgi:hypothetical protein